MVGRRIVLFFVVTAFFLFLTACSQTDRNKTSSDADMDANDDANDMAEMTQETEEVDEGTDNSTSRESAGDGDEDRATAEPESDRMVIYTADMAITMSDFQQAQSDLQSLIDEAEGYIVNSSVSDRDDSGRQGKITTRIPQRQFDDFLDQIEEIADEVEERNVNGEDVTKEHVDLESRLDAKKEVKKRLEKLMEEADDSDDLLDISDKLSETQEQMETISGQIQYLENHTSMSTVNITITEENVEVDGVKKWDDLNTWQKTKKIFVSSINAIITFFSGVVIFLVGSSPILVPIILIAVVIYWIFRKRRRKQE